MAGRPIDIERRTILKEFMQGEGRGLGVKALVKALSKHYPTHTWHRTTLRRWLSPLSS